MKAVAEIFKLASRINIKPKDIIGMGGDIVKMGKSLFNTKVNPKLTEFISDNGKIPTKIVEEIKVHLRSLKNASDNQVELFKLNLKDIVNAKFPPKADMIKLPVSSSKKSGILAADAADMAAVETMRKIQQQNMKKMREFLIKNQSSKTAIPLPGSGIKQPATSVKDAAEAFKGWTPTVIKGGKDPKFNEGGIAELNAELNQLPEYYLPMATGGRTGFGSGSPRHGNYTVDEIVEFKNMLISNGYSPGEANDHIRYLLRNNLEFNFEIPFAIGGIANHFRAR